MTQAIKYNSQINYNIKELNSLSTSISAATQSEYNNISYSYTALSRSYASHILPIIIKQRSKLFAACCGFSKSFNNKNTTTYNKRLEYHPRNTTFTQLLNTINYTIMKTITIIILALVSLNAFSTTFQVGPTKTYTSPHALYQANVVQNGDIIEIDSATYTGQACTAVWQKDNLIIRGVGGRPSLVASGNYIWGKGIWVLAGDNITVDNISFSGAAVPDHNGAGIRLDGSGMTVRHCYFFDNENGILTNNINSGDVVIEYSEFNQSGYGDGYSHNIYIGHINRLVFRFNYTHHAKVGHCLKSRAKENFILYNRIMDEQTGNSSRLIDIPNGGLSVIMGNILMQGPNALNNNMIGYGKEGLSNAGPQQLFIINNTLVNKRTGSCLFLDIQSGASTVVVSNNIFAGTGTLLNGTTTSSSNNVVETNIAGLEFVNESNYDYHLNSNSPAVNAGIAIPSQNNINLTPDSAYKHPVDFELRQVSGTIDAGAYEYKSSVGMSKVPQTQISIYPNPTQDIIHIGTSANNVKSIAIYDCSGALIKQLSNSYSIDLQGFPKGIYFLRIETQNGGNIMKKVVRE